MEFIVVIVSVIVGWIFISSYLSRKRREALLAKYGDAELVDKIMRGMFWQGQSQEQLVDSLGRPLDIDEKVLKPRPKKRGSTTARARTVSD